MGKWSWGTFVAGATIGGAVGAAAGVIFGQHASNLLGSFVGVVDRKLSEAERDRIRFDLLQQ